MLNLMLTAQKQLLPISIAIRDKKICINDIVMIEGDSNYSCLYLKDGKKICVAKTLRTFEEVLNTYYFIRTHKGYLINLLHLIDFDLGHEFVVRMEGGLKAGVSRRKKNYFTRQAYDFQRNQLN